MCEPHTKKLEELEMGLDNITFDFILNIMQTYAESLDKKIKPIKSGEEKDKS
jgi:hypothetical protein